MSFSDMFSGRGSSVAFRLMIEGWPDEWVTDVSITHATNADGRTIRPGLLYQGLVIADRIIMQEGKCTSDGIKFKVRSDSFREEALASFSKFPEPVAALTVNLEADDASIGTVLPSIGTGVFHLGTEAIRVAGDLSIDRHIWDTQRQAHHVIGGLGSSVDPTRQVFIYDFPPSMTGRRCALYIYGRGDDMAGDGFCLWRGFVGRPPTLDSDGTTWVIDAQPITQILQQSVAGFIKEGKPANFFYHHNECAAFMIVDYNGANTGAKYKYTGVDTEQSLQDNVSAMMSTMLTDIGASLIQFVKLDRQDGQWRLHMRTDPSTSPPSNVSVHFISPILGVAGGLASKWSKIDISTNQIISNVGQFTNDQDYVSYLKADPSLARVMVDGLMAHVNSPCFPLGNVNPLMSMGSSGYFEDTSAGLDPWTVLVAEDMDGSEQVVITGTAKPGGAFKVLSSGISGGVHFLQLEPWAWLGLGPIGVINPFLGAASAGFMGFLDENTTITPIRDYGSGNVGTFVENVKTQAVNANDGDTPFITDADLADWSAEFHYDIASDQSQLARVYAFSKPQTLETILAEELKYANHFIRVEVQGNGGRLGIAPLPSFTNATPIDSDHVIDDSTIVTPAGNYGRWPEWQPQRDGLITAIDIKFGYDGLQDQWAATTTYQRADSIAIHKTRGKVQATIAPYSHAVVEPTIGVNSAFEQIAQNFLNVFARDYGVVRVAVTWRNFFVQCGDVVSLTHRLIPAGDGTRGVVNRRGVCIERRWNLDPKDNEMGTLTIMMPLEALRGYAPSARVGHSLVSGTTYNITADATDARNIDWSSNGNGLVFENFKVGDYIRIVTRDDDSSTEVTGTITVINAAAGTGTVALDAAWPAGSDWMMEFQLDTGALHTADQLKFMYVADDTLILPSTEFARRYA